MTSSELCTATARNRPQFLSNPARCAHTCQIRNLRSNHSRRRRAALSPLNTHLSTILTWLARSLGWLCVRAWLTFMCRTIEPQFCALLNCCQSEQFARERVTGVNHILYIHKSTRLISASHSAHNRKVVLGIFVWHLRVNNILKPPQKPVVSKCSSRGLMCLYIF